MWLSDGDKCSEYYSESMIIIFISSYKPDHLFSYDLTQWLMWPREKWYEDHFCWETQ